MKKLLCWLAVLSVLFIFCGCVKEEGAKKTIAENNKTIAKNIYRGAVPWMIDAEMSFPVTTDDSTTAADTTAAETTAEITTSPDTTDDQTTVVNNKAVITEQTEKPVTETEPLPPPPPPPVTPPTMNECLFIGDSRTVGLQYYAGITGADFFASTGMNVLRIMSDVLTVPGVGDVNLPQLLQMRQYGKIYIMLGINEIGYDHGFVIGKYSELVNAVRTSQPDATVYIEANLRIVASRSASDPVYNNAQMNDLNAGMKALADGKKIKYIDVNPLFDDGTGALDGRYTFDDFHLQSQYYPQWGAWIAENS